jgi:histidine kinase 2/3/4 (cytokinin receptor)
MEEKGGAAGLGFLGLDRMRLLLPPPFPEKLSARSLRTHLTGHILRWRWVREQRRWLLTIWVILWVAASAGLLVYMTNQAVEKRRESLASMCDERARMLQDQFNVSMNHLQALAVLVSTFHHSKTPSAIDQVSLRLLRRNPTCSSYSSSSSSSSSSSPPANRFDLRCLLLLLLLLQTTFARYAERTAFERPLTSGVAYAVKVTHAEREQFERQQGWSIKKMYSSKKQSTGAGDAEVREPAEEYAPVIFAQDAYKHVVSFDMLSGNVSTLRLSVSRFLSSFFTPMPTGTRGLLQKKKSCDRWCSTMCSLSPRILLCPFSVLRDRITDGKKKECWCHDQWLSIY